MYYQEWSCAWSKLDEQAPSVHGTYELERLVWHAVANGGYYIEIDKESQRSGTSIAKDIKAHGHTGELARLCTARIAWKSDPIAQQRT